MDRSTGTDALTAATGVGVAVVTGTAACGAGVDEAETSATACRSLKEDSLFVSSSLFSFLDT